VAVLTDPATLAATGFKSVIMQAYDYNGVSGVTPADYTADWSNAPEPASMLLLGAGLLGLGALRGRRRVNPG
jgi:hypothetical protein